MGNRQLPTRPARTREISPWPSADVYRALRRGRVSRGLLNETDAARLAHFRLDAVLGFELLEELFGRELRREDLHLALHGREISRAQLVELADTGTRLRRERVLVAVERLDDEHLLALGECHWLEPDLEREAPQRRLVDAVHQVRRADEDAGKPL